MTRAKFIFITLVALLFLNNCTITDYQNYRFTGYGASTGSKKDGNYTVVYIYVNNSIYEYKKLYPFRNRLIYKEPYTYYFTIHGNFEKIENLDAYFLQNKTKKIKIPVLAVELNKNRDKSSYRVNYAFSYGKKLELPIKWDETETLEVVVNFTGIENGKRKKYSLKNEYEKKAIKENVNLILENIKSW